MANLITNVNQACADLANIKKAIIDNGVEVANGTPSSEYSSKVNAVYEAGKAYAYDNPQTPTDGRDRLSYWYAYLNYSLGNIWDDYYDEETWDLISPRHDESTWLESLEYPKGTGNVTMFDYALVTTYWDEYMCCIDFTGIPTRKYTGTLDMRSAMSVRYTFGYDSKVQDAGTIILPTSPDCRLTDYMFTSMYNLVKIRFVGTIQWNFAFAQSPNLDGDTIRHIVGALSGTTTGKTLTLKRDAVSNAISSNAMSSDEWNELIDEKDNWTISLV